nr:hypothetical protein [Tanacetum cinerariifolium]
GDPVAPDWPDAPPASAHWPAAGLGAVTTMPGHRPNPGTARWRSGPGIRGPYAPANSKRAPVAPWHRRRPCLCRCGAP